MAHFRCDACRRSGVFDFDGRVACPRCDSPRATIWFDADERDDDDIFWVLHGLDEDDPRVREH